MSNFADTYVMPGQDASFIAPVVGVVTVVAFVFLFGGGNQYKAREKARKRRKAELKRELEEEQRQIQQLQFNIAFDKNNPEIRKQIDKALQEASQVNKNPASPFVASSSLASSPIARVVLPSMVEGQTTPSSQGGEEGYMSGIEFSSHPRPNFTTIINED
ncbi:hypothetical protein BGZ52_001434 [Haplosporangium bisporale]|nr:hypothetical protein BGZ52_001434 [Haplosporangium bisporale]KAF9206099.1 hypothetical protein BGZ59_000123 [Podila verticillata]KAI9241804.1 MAG: hypothetical protein BYD32DRAFT_432884 [Podila humilis]KFH69826.1 hypothetical protein MVEG_04630 [Podila verticillata NRRL 6337]